MAPSTSIHVPTAILADCRFAAAPNYPGTTPRPSGAGLTGADIALLLIVLDGAVNANEKNNVFIPQVRFRQLAGKADPVRISAALTRLEGTDLMHGNSVLPCVRSYTHIGKGSKNPHWAVELHPRVIDLVKKATGSGVLTALNTDAMKKLSSRLSIVLWLRWMSILDGAYPPSQIGFGKDEHTAAMEISVKLDDVPAFLGRSERMLPSEIDRLVVTASPRSPIAREMHAAGVATDIVTVDRAGFKDRFGIQIQMTTLQHQGLAYVSKLQRHRDLRLAARRTAREARMRRPAAPSA